MLFEKSTSPTDKKGGGRSKPLSYKQIKNIIKIKTEETHRGAGTACRFFWTYLFFS